MRYCSYTSIAVCNRLRPMRRIVAPAKHHARDPVFIVYTNTCRTTTVITSYKQTSCRRNARGTHGISSGRRSRRGTQRNNDNALRSSNARVFRPGRRRRRRIQGRLTRENRIVLWTRTCTVAQSRTDVYFTYVQFGRT